MLTTAACDEAEAYARQCGRMDALLSKDLRRVHGVRALHIVYPGKNNLGLGHALAHTYRLRKFAGFEAATAAVVAAAAWL
jgi:hypothetical protein